MLRHTESSGRSIGEGRKRWWSCECKVDVCWSEKEREDGVSDGPEDKACLRIDIRVIA